MDSSLDDVYLPRGFEYLSPEYTRPLLPVGHLLNYAETGVQLGENERLNLLYRRFQETLAGAGLGIISLLPRPVAEVRGRSEWGALFMWLGSC